MKTPRTLRERIGIGILAKPVFKYFKNLILCNNQTVLRKQCRERNDLVLFILNVMHGGYIIRT